MFIFGGRSGAKRFVHSVYVFPLWNSLILLILEHWCFRLGDFWVLDTGKVQLSFSINFWDQLIIKYKLGLSNHQRVCMSFLWFLSCWNNLWWLLLLLSDIWQWSELTGFGDLPPARDFAAGAPIGNQKIVMCVLMFNWCWFLTFVIWLYPLFKS